MTQDLMLKLKKSEMKKFIFGTAVAIGLFLMIIVATAFDQNVASTEIKEGDSITKFEIENAETQITIGEPRDYYTLLIFWQSTDATSRMACSNYAGILKTNPELDGKVRIVAVNFDEKEDLFNEIVRADGLDAGNQFYVEPYMKAILSEVFDLENGMYSILVSPQGKVLAFNPDAEQLSRC